jgi:hypothetical protein
MSRTQVGKAVFSILTTDAAVSAIVGAKVYPRTAPQGIKIPYVVYSIISVTPTDTKDRPSPLDAVRVQIDCYDRTYMGCETLHGKVRDAIDAYEIGATVAGVKLDGIKYETENDTIDEDVDIFRRSADYIIRVKY